MPIYVKINPDRIMQYDYGYDLTGSTYDDRQGNVPHDLTQYDSVFMKYSRQGGDNTSFTEGEVMVGEGEGNEHKFTWTIPQGAFYYPGYFNFYLTMVSTGLSRTTLPANFVVNETAARERDVG